MNCVKVFVEVNSKFVENTNWDKKLKLSLSAEDGYAKRLIIVENDKWIGDINLTSIAPNSAMNNNYFKKKKIRPLTEIGVLIKFFIPIEYCFILPL